MNATHDITATVVICTRNRAGVLARCLQHVAKLDYPRFEVLVVDNGSTDETEETVRAYGARYQRTPEPGLSCARNDGARHSNTEIIAYIDDDAVPDRNWLAALAAEFRDRDVLAVAGHIEPLTEPMTLEFSGNQLATLRKVDKSTPHWFSITNFGGIGDGGNMAFRRSAFTLWPGFDERLGLGSVLGLGEEHYAFFSLVALGGRCVFSPHAVVHHLPDPDERQIWNYEAGIAYSLFLFKEQPQWRGELLKHLFKHFASRERTWREHRSIASGTPLTLSAKIGAALSGIRNYCKMEKLGHPKTPLLPKELH